LLRVSHASIVLLNTLLVSFVNLTFKVFSFMIVFQRIQADIAAWVVNLQNISKCRRSLVFLIHRKVIREMSVEFLGYGDREIFFFLKIL
jgi:hypothetical protein